jgi:alkylhydroperoxidase family enzyme
MARISYVDDTAHPEDAALIDKIRSGRRGTVINIYKLLLHAPALAATWFDHISAVRWKTKLDGRLRELAIVRLAHAARYAYAMNQHVPGIALADGVTLAECDALADWRAARVFDAREQALLAYVDAMFAGPEVPDDVFDALRRHFDEREVLEITVLIGTYIMHNRVFTALRVDLEPQKA